MVVKSVPRAATRASACAAGAGSKAAAELRRRAALLDAGVRRPEPVARSSRATAPGRRSTSAEPLEAVIEARYSARAQRRRGARALPGGRLRRLLLARLGGDAAAAARRRLLAPRPVGRQRPAGRRRSGRVAWPASSISSTSRARARRAAHASRSACATSRACRSSGAEDRAALPARSTADGRRRSSSGACSRSPPRLPSGRTRPRTGCAACAARRETLSCRAARTPTSRRRRPRPRCATASSGTTSPTSRTSTPAGSPSSRVRLADAGAHAARRRRSSPRRCRGSGAATGSCARELYARAGRWRGVGVAAPPLAGGPRTRCSPRSRSWACATSCSASTPGRTTTPPRRSWRASSRRAASSCAFALPQNRELVRDPARWRAAVEELGDALHPLRPRSFQVGQAINRSKWGIWSLARVRRAGGAAARGRSRALLRRARGAVSARR